MERRSNPSSREFPWWGVALVLTGCGPTVDPPEDAMGSTAEMTTAPATTSTPDGTNTGPDSTTGPPADSTGPGTGSEADDAELCLQWCLNAEARDCPPPFSGKTCYTRCLDSLASAEEQGCRSERRDLLACESLAPPPAELYCESLSCEDEYKRSDLCRGFCSHLGGIPGGGASPTECDWRSTCYGHEFEAVCPSGPEGGTCACLVDDRVIVECELPEPLPSIECDPSIHVFTTCCREAFEGVLFP